MAKTPVNDTVYNTNTLSKWFAIASIALLIAMVWAVIEDYERPWKDYDRQAKKIAAAIGESKLRGAQAAMEYSKLKGLEAKFETLDEAQKPALQKEIDALKEKIKELEPSEGYAKDNAPKVELEKLEAKLAELAAQEASLVAEFDAKIKAASDHYYEVNQVYQFEKASLDALQFEVETAAKELSEKAPKLKADYEALFLKVAKLKAKADKAERAVNEAKTSKKDMLSNQKKLADLKLKVTADIVLLKKTIEANAPSIGNTLRNAPLVDFVSPTVKINQVVLPNLLDDYFMNKVVRVDRCITCHATIDKKGFEDFPQPFKTHPKLDLITGPDSPHPVQKLGCTACHSGVGNSVDFTLSAHTAGSAEKEMQWEEKYGYHRSHHIKTHMVPTDMLQGKCIQCHANQVQLDQAPNLNAGYRMIERYGCYGCHKINDHFTRLAKEKKPGPSLTRLASKLEKEWVAKWLWNPTSFRPSTLMPAFWQNHNNSDEASLKRGAVEVESITHYLFQRSKEFQPITTASQLQGDIESGKALVGSVGCLGCHAVEDFQRSQMDDPKVLGWKDPRVPNPGPELNQMGSKVSREWLTSWLLKPKHYWDQTSMPSMKLSNKEAADIAAYLLSKRNENFDQLNPPEAEDSTRDQLVMDYLNKTLAPKDAKTKLASMSLDEKKDFLGQKFVNHYGCYGCHAIEGFENAPNIGADLSTEGSKDITKFVFDNVNIDHTSREEWVYTKIRTPRIWDVGKLRDFEGKTRMPQFNLTHEQARVLASVIIGHENKNVRDEALYKVDGRMEQVIEGHRVLNRYNCVSCHAIENQNGHILGYYQDDITLGPPNLNTEGQKLQTEWLHDYLQNTNVMIRPWLKVRMPTFYMSPEEATVITKYFAAFDRAPYPFMNQSFNPLIGNDLAQAQKLFSNMGCLSCHAVRKPGESVADAAPHLANVKKRLRSDWIVKWLRNPEAIMPGTKMPQNWPQMDADDPHSNMAIPGYFGDNATEQMMRMRDYLFQYPGEMSLPPAAVERPWAKNALATPKK